MCYGYGYGRARGTDKGIDINFVRCTVRGI